MINYVELFGYLIFIENTLYYIITPYGQFPCKSDENLPLYHPLVVHGCLVNDKIGVLIDVECCDLY